MIRSTETSSNSIPITFFRFPITFTPCKKKTELGTKKQLLKLGDLTILETFAKKFKRRCVEGSGQINYLAKLHCIKYCQQRDP